MSFLCFRSTVCLVTIDIFLSVFGYRRPFMSLVLCSGATWPWGSTRPTWTLPASKPSTMASAPGLSRRIPPQVSPTSTPCATSGTPPPTSGFSAWLSQTWRSTTIRIVCTTSSWCDGLNVRWIKHAWLPSRLSHMDVTSIISHATCTLAATCMTHQSSMLCWGRCFSTRRLTLHQKQSLSWNVLWTAPKPNHGVHCSPDKYYPYILGIVCSCGK